MLYLFVQGGGGGGGGYRQSSVWHHNIEIYIGIEIEIEIIFPSPISVGTYDYLSALLCKRKQMTYNPNLSY